MKSKFIIFFSTLLFCALFTSGVQAQDTTKTKNKKAQHSQRFVDKDGDGYNDNAPDHDGDGIPNGLDPDWLKLKKEKGKKLRFVDLDGDGINDNLQASEQKKSKNQKQMKDDSGSSMDSRQQKQKGQKKHGDKR
ncbi:MAG: hypothetical protein K8R79_05935 [Calditrichales bacterium]|nr:hypothetical protein [Calditrichales bacterium]